MKTFLDENFMLESETSQTLYHKYAKDMPIIDYHCHLSPKEIYENRQFKNMTEIWLDGDHYKWRAMRANGIDESLITGDRDDYDKFLAWAKTVPMLIGNPLYHWTHLELQRFFGIDTVLNEKSAPAIWEQVNEQLQTESFSARELIKKSMVKVVCTTDDPIDSLEYHKLIKEEKYEVKVVPGFRPDKALAIDKGQFGDYLNKLSEASNQSINSYSDFLASLRKRVVYFHENDGRVSDHALDTVNYIEATEEEVSNIFDRALKGETLDSESVIKFKSFTLTYLGELYHEFGWVMQYHMNAHRNNNTRMFNALGPDTGFDSINDTNIAQPLVKLLDSLDKNDKLPQTILYSLNPNDNPIIGSMIGSFQDGSIPGKIQFGTAWWFNDTNLGMRNQLEFLADMGLLSRFIGMLTDSRSFLSYPRHEYFRRVLCNFIGNWVENGEVPNDEAFLGDIIKGISYNNAKAYFDFDLD